MSIYNKLESKQNFLIRHLRDTIRDANTGGEEARLQLLMSIGETLLWFLENAKVEE